MKCNFQSTVHLRNQRSTNTTKRDNSHFCRSKFPLKGQIVIFGTNIGTHNPPDSSTYVPVHVLVLTTRVFFPTVMSYLQHVTHIVVHAFHKSAEYFHPLFPVNELGENKTLSRLCPLTINIFFNTNFE